MKNIFLVVPFFFVLISNAFADFEIDRVWSENDYLYVLVSYINKTNESFDAVTIECIALDDNNKKINVNRRSFFGHSYGGSIGSGFTGTVKIPIELHGLDAKSASCKLILR